MHGHHHGPDAIGLAGDLGSTEPGKLADLVVLAGNPLDDLWNTNAVEQVMVNGRLYDGGTVGEVYPRQRAAAAVLVGRGAGRRPRPGAVTGARAVREGVVRFRGRLASRRSRRWRVKARRHDLRLGRRRQEVRHQAASRGRIAVSRSRSDDVWIAAATEECNGHLLTFDRDYSRIPNFDHTLLDTP